MVGTPYQDVKAKCHYLLFLWNLVSFIGSEM